MKVSFTLLQRISLDNIILARRVVDGKDYITIFKVWEKFTVSDEEKQEYILQSCPTCGTPSRLDVKKVNDADLLEIEMESGEARELQGVLKDYKLSVADGKWYFPLKALLTETAGEPGIPASSAPSAGPAAKKRAH